MIELYTWGTSNGRKITIALEELSLPYRIVPVNIMKDEQFDPAFLAISPNNKIPAIVDRTDPERPQSIFESGAILIHLAEKTGRLMPSTGPARLEVLQWLMFQVGGLGPMLGQVHYFRRAAPEPVPAAIERYGREARRLYGVLDRRLADRPHVAGDYSIADIALYPWISRHDWQDIALSDFPNVERWFRTLGERPAVRRGMELP